MTSSKRSELESNFFSAEHKPLPAPLVQLTSKRIDPLTPAMDYCDQCSLHEFINLPFSEQQSQQHLPRGVSRKRKFEIPKDELKDEDFDQIVVETSRLVTSSARMQQLNGTTSNYLEQMPSKSLGSNQSNRQSSECSPESKWSQHTNESVLIGGSGARINQDANQPKRPMNAFMVWGQAIRRELHNKFSNVQNAVLSKALGRVWKRLDFSEKEPYITRANIIKSNHKRDYPNYRYQPRRIQEKQRRMQQTGSHSYGHETKQQRTRPVSSSGAPKRSTEPTDVIIVCPYLFD